jgi:hypothetical protein
MHLAVIVIKCISFYRYIEMAKNETLVKRQDFFSVLNFLAYNPEGNPIVWGFYRYMYSTKGGYYFMSGLSIVVKGQHHNDK